MSEKAHEFIDKNSIGCCNSYFRIDTNKIVENYKKVQAYIGEDVGIIPVIKGNCYGYGLVEMAKIFTERCHSEIVADAAIYEAVQLRDAGIKSEILIIGGIPQHLLKVAVEKDLQIPLFNKETAVLVNEEAANRNKKIKVHIKIETGMNRLGVKPGEPLDELLDYVSTLPNIEIVGAYTHFATSTADYNDAFAIEQHEKFKVGLKQLEDRKLNLKYVHCCNSAATAWFKDAYHTHVRICSSLLGQVAMEDGREPIGLEEPCELRAFITNIHDVEKGDSVGYSRYFKPEKHMRIATLSIGFADGIYPPWAKKQGPAIVSGHKTKLLGICMDQSFVDVTDIPCEIGQEATLIGKDGDEEITTRDIEVFTDNTFEYLFGTFGPRMARVYL